MVRIRLWGIVYHNYNYSKEPQESTIQQATGRMVYYNYKFIVRSPQKEAGCLAHRSAFGLRLAVDAFVHLREVEGLGV